MLISIHYIFPGFYPCTSITGIKSVLRAFNLVFIAWSVVLTCICSIQPTVRLTYIKKSGGGMWGKGACSKAWVLKLFFRIEMSRKSFCLPGGSEAIFGNFIHYGNWNNYNFSVGGGLAINPTPIYRCHSINSWSMAVE